MSALQHLAEARKHESTEWIRDLRSEGTPGEEAIVRLRALLLRAARFEVDRRRAALPQLSRDELDDIAIEAAGDALASVLGRLDEFRGASRFTTWASKFALLEAAVEMRKRSWEDAESRRRGRPGVDLDAEAELEQSGLLATLKDAIASVLTPHERHVLVALTLHGVPIDVLAEQLDTTRGAVYASLHDARGKLRRHVIESGIG